MLHIAVYVWGGAQVCDCVRMQVPTVPTVPTAPTAPTAVPGANDMDKKYNDLQDNYNTLLANLTAAELTVGRQRGDLDTLYRSNGILTRANDDLNAKYTELKAAHEKLKAENVVCGV